MITLSEKYARALFGASTDLGCVEDVADELPALRELAQRCAEYLNSPRVDIRVKVAAVQDTLSGRVNALTLEFFKLILRRCHLKHLSGVPEHFKRMCDDYSHKATVTLRTPFALDRETVGRLKSRFERDGLIPASAESITFKVTEDKDLIGGFIAQCNGRQIDASVKSQLTKVRRLK